MTVYKYENEFSSTFSLLHINFRRIHAVLVRATLVLSAVVYYMLFIGLITVRHPSIYKIASAPRKLGAHIYNPPKAVTFVSYLICLYNSILSLFDKSPLPGACLARL